MQKLDCKIVLVGSISCGKTSLILRFVKNSFKDHLPATYGASYMCKTVTVKNVKMKLQIWDTAGQEEYHSLVGMYFRKSDAVILVYDITSSKSFADVKKWKAEIEKYAPSTAIVTLVGSKIDLDKSRVISTKQGLQTAKSIDAMFFEVSAKEDKGVNELFDAINDKILAKRREKGDEIIDDYEIVDSTPENIDLWNSNNQTITPSSSKSIRERCCKG